MLSTECLYLMLTSSFPKEYTEAGRGNLTLVLQHGKAKMQGQPVFGLLTY